MIMHFNTVVTIPVYARPSYFISGVLDHWDNALPGMTDVQMTLDFTGEIEIEEGDDKTADEIIEVIIGGEWRSDYSDKMLASALVKACNEKIDEEKVYANSDIDSGDGCDGTVYLVLEDDVEFSDPEWLDFYSNEIMPAEVKGELSRIGHEIANDVAFGDAGYPGSLFYLVSDGAVCIGSPYDADAWEDPIYEEE